MGYSDGDQLKVSIQCRKGPIEQRRCTDVICCLIYVLLLGAVIFLAIFASQAISMPRADLQAQLNSQNEYNPMLAITTALNYILMSLAFVTALCFLLFVVGFILPAIAVYILLPLMLLLMLLLGVGFIYHYFGQKIPFVNQRQLDGRVPPYSILSLVIGIAFLVGFVVSLIVIIVKSDRFRYILPVLNIAKACFWQNCYMIFISFALTVVSLGSLYLNIWFLQISLLQKNGQQLIDKKIFTVIILVQMLWTHGYLQAYSDFLFESIALHWYYNEKNPEYKDGYSKLAKNLWPSICLSFRHIGTISFGFLLAYIPQSLSILLHRCEQNYDSLYHSCCVCHKFTCANLNKYNFISTIMFSESFCAAGGVMGDIRANVKVHFRELYMVGNFYITLVKLFAVLSGLIVLYIMLMEAKPEFYFNTINLIAPLLVMLLASTEIATHFTNASGLVGDTIYFAYEIDYNCESLNFGNFNADHCPQAAYEIMQEARASKFSLE